MSENPDTTDEQQGPAALALATTGPTYPYTPHVDNRNWFQRHLFAIGVVAAIAVVVTVIVLTWPSQQEQAENRAMMAHIGRYLWSFPVDLYHWTLDTALPWINDHIFQGRWHRTA
ncbi:MAG TPA: hypothetical protein VFT64_03825 [Rickettsiales bacterium]|nr:hypothetical protein [Rickettsiales bacterium]